MWCKLRLKYVIDKVIRTQASSDGSVTEHTDYKVYQAWEYVTLVSSWRWPSHLPGRLGQVTTWLDKAEQLLEIPRALEESHDGDITNDSLVKGCNIRRKIQIWLARYWVSTSYYY